MAVEEVADGPQEEEEEVKAVDTRQEVNTI